MQCDFLPGQKKNIVQLSSELGNLQIKNEHRSFSHLIKKAAERRMAVSFSYDVSSQLPLILEEDQRLIDMLILPKQADGKNHPVIAYLTILTEHTLKLLESASTEEQKKAIVMTYREEAGSIIYLADRNPESTANLLDPMNLLQSRLNVDRAIKNDFVDISKQLEKFYILQQESVFPNPSNSLAVRMALTFAQIFITNSRCFNAMLVPKVISHFLTHLECPSPYHKRFKDVLLALMNITYHPNGLIKNLQERFREIQCPFTENEKACSRSNLMIKSALGLNGNDKLTQKDVAVVALLHLLGWSRQTDTGTCYVEWLQIELLTERMDIAFSDVKSLIEYGALFRKVDGDIVAFEFTSSLANSANARPIEIDATGKICRSNDQNTWWFKKIFNSNSITPMTGVYFWQTSPYQAAIKIWGIPEGSQQKLYYDVLKKLITSKQSVLTNMTKLISLTAEIWCEQNFALHQQKAKKLENMEIEGNYAAEALDNHVTQRAWISAAATFQESPHISQRFTRTIKNCALAAINLLIEDGIKNSNEYHVIENELGKSFVDQTQIQYNMAQLEPKKQEKFGFFVLHRRDLLVQLDTVDSGIPVLTAKQFQKFSEKALDNVIAYHLVNNESEHSKPAYLSVLKAFRNAIQNSEYVPNVVAQFQQKMDSAFINGVIQLPWKWWSGGFAISSYIVGMGQPLHPKDSSVIAPKTVMDLVSWYLQGLYNYCLETGDWNFNNAPPYMCGSLQGHVFNWFVGNNSVNPLLQYMHTNQCDPEEAFNHFLMPAAKAVNELSISLAMIDKLLASIIEKLKKEPFFIETELVKHELDGLVEKCKKGSHHLTIGIVCNQILQLLYTKITQPEAQELLALEMASFVLKHIDDESFRKYAEPMVLGADSNWEDETGVELRRVCFFMSISPITLLPFMGQINDLKTRTGHFMLLPNYSNYYAMHDFTVKGVPNPSITPM